MIRCIRNQTLSIDIKINIIGMFTKRKFKNHPKLPNLVERWNIKWIAFINDLTWALTEQDKNSKNNDTLHSLKLVITSYAFSYWMHMEYIYTIGTDTLYTRSPSRAGCNYHKTFCVSKLFHSNLNQQVWPNIFISILNAE